MYRQGPRYDRDSTSQIDPRPARPAESVLMRAIQENFRDLTSREREVLKMVIEGKPIRIIAFALGISPLTVGAHRVAILRRTLKGKFTEVAKPMIRGWSHWSQD